MVLAGSSAFADDETYEPPPAPAFSTLVETPICDGDVPYLAYDVQVENTDATDLTITFINPNGEDYVVSGLSVGSGRILWPGAVVAADGTALDWPGWSLVNGEWVEGDEYDWVRPSVQVRISVNPEATVDVAYPPSTPNCATNPPSDGSVPTSDATPVSASADGLPRTGAEIAAYAGGAAALLAIGAGLVVWTRRRKPTES
ncbi:hypothetical protein GCM10025865_18710 [Paraoerskovia sediminicola]|uniref:LPXTG-motif cell wall anchor domain-containing protein n=2 Tax=Paraoerskovia sediminicola TaxID=1138587 RepID=A0ABM8G3B9_9CELL|nr:hypothetical protein GCM10025865_18710 [Paraoerskovia sediminicola]